MLFRQWPLQWSATRIKAILSYFLKLICAVCLYIIHHVTTIVNICISFALYFLHTSSVHCHLSHRITYSLLELRRSCRSLCAWRCQVMTSVLQRTNCITSSSSKALMLWRYVSFTDFVSYTITFILNIHVIPIIIVIGVLKSAELLIRITLGLHLLSKSLQC